MGKIIIEPDSEWIGSTEWVGLKRQSEDVPLLLIAYLLMLPELCEAYRRLQSGKRHARLDPQEMLDLAVTLLSAEQLTPTLMEIERQRNQISSFRAKAVASRSRIDSAFHSENEQQD